MNFDDVKRRYKANNKILFRKESPSFVSLNNQLQTADRQVVVLWALDCAKEALREFNKDYPNELRAKTCIDSCEQWAFNETSMKHAKKAILDLHSAAKEKDDLVFQSYCHAIAQAGSCVHTQKHALGLVLYECSACIFKYGFEKGLDQVIQKIDFYHERLNYWQNEPSKSRLNWALFLRKKENDRI